MEAFKFIDSNAGKLDTKFAVVAASAIAIDQHGEEGKPAQTRLYVYPDVDSHVLYLITIGDKKSQRQDNASCREFMVWLTEQNQDVQSGTETQSQTDSS
jgi:hypothetical protein